MEPEHFFQSTPFLRRVLAPVLILFGIGLPFMTTEWTLGGALVVGGMSLAMLLYAAMLVAPKRLWWAGRAVAGLVFVGYLAYAVHEWFFTDHSFRLAESRSQSSPRNALLGLLGIGIPCLIYALRGPRKRPVIVERDFADRSPAEQIELLKHTWCDECETADLGMHNPVEYEVDGVIYVEGLCVRCGSTAFTAVTEREARVG